MMERTDCVLRSEKKSNHVRKYDYSIRQGKKICAALEIFEQFFLGRRLFYWRTADNFFDYGYERVWWIRKKNNFEDLFLLFTLETGLIYEL